MSYCRVGTDSDVYVIASGLGIECVACRCLTGYRSFTVAKPEAMLAHLAEHERRGDRVPKRALDRLRREAGQ